MTNSRDEKEKSLEKNAKKNKKPLFTGITNFFKQEIIKKIGKKGGKKGIINQDQGKNQIVKSEENEKIYDLDEEDKKIDEKIKKEIKKTVPMLDVDEKDLEGTGNEIVEDETDAKKPDEKKTEKIYDPDEEIYDMDEEIQKEIKKAVPMLDVNEEDLEGTGNKIVEDETDEKKTDENKNIPGSKPKI